MKIGISTDLIYDVVLEHQTYCQSISYLSLLNCSGFAVELTGEGKAHSWIVALLLLHVHVISSLQQLPSEQTPAVQNKLCEEPLALRGCCLERVDVVCAVGQGLVYREDYRGRVGGVSVSASYGCDLTWVVVFWGLSNVSVHAAVTVQTPSVAEVEVML